MNLKRRYSQGVIITKKIEDEFNWHRFHNVRNIQNVVPLRMYLLKGP